MFEDDPLEGVYSFVEKAYASLQAGDELFRCLEEQNTTDTRLGGRIGFGGTRDFDGIAGDFERSSSA